MQQQQDQDVSDKEHARGQVLHLPVISGILPDMLSIFQKQNQQSDILAVILFDWF